LRFMCGHVITIAVRLDFAGDDAVLVDLGDVTAKDLHAANRRALAVAGVVRSVPGHSSLYVVFDGPVDRGRYDALARAVTDAGAATAGAGVEHRVDVRFDGENLSEFLERVGISRAEFLRRADGLRLTARYIGFRGGFAYLDGWPPEWSMPRRTTSRPVAAGSFAVAGHVAAFYPIDSPGGWNVLGHTETDLENALQPGDTIMLAVDAHRQGRPIAKRQRSSVARAGISVNAPLATWTQRPFDAIAAALANEAAGNACDAEVLECPMVGPRVRFLADAVIAWCGPDRRGTARRVKAGDEWSLGRIEGGFRGYLAYRFEDEHEDRLKPVLHSSMRVSACGTGFSLSTPARRDGDRLRIGAMCGPHDLGWRSVECEVLPQLDRVGIRLRPLQPVNAQIPADLRSIGMQMGTVQLHPNGDLVAMGPDHPVTGGYLQPLTVLSQERWKLAQLAPGERVTFVGYEPNS